MKVFLLLIIFSLLGTLVYAADEVKAFYREVSTSEELYAAVKAIPSGEYKGANIKIRPGVYEIREPLYMKDVNMINIEGSGWNTQLKKIGDGDLMVLDGVCWNNAITNLMFEGDLNSKNGSGLVVKNGKWSGITSIEKCNFIRFPESGVKIEGIKDTPVSSYIIKSCWFTDNRGNQLHFINSNDFFILENNFGRGGKAGCLLENSSAGTYSMNYHWDNKNALRLTNNCHFNRIENNRFEESYETGVIFGEKGNNNGTVSLNIFTGNTVHSNSKNNYGKFNAIEMYNTVDLTFTNNQVFSWNNQDSSVKSCLVMDNTCSGFVIKDNIFKHHVAEALIYPQKAGCIVKDNLIDKNMPAK